MPPGAGSGPGIELVGLRKQYGDRLALRGLTLTVARGEVFGLVGPNGAGKTTTMRCVAGLVRPTAGTVRVAGHDVQTASLDARRALAMIPDVPQLFPHLTVEEHVRLVARLYGVADVEQKLGPLFDELQLTDRVRELPGALSRGMRQKVAVACGLVHDPEALLFDEPLTGLDPVAIRRLKRIIRARADAGAAVVVSSHLLGLVEEIADRVAVLMEGEVVASGDLADLRSQRPELADAGLEEIFLRVTGAGDT